MKKIAIFILAFSALIFHSCESDFDTTYVTYIKAQAIYGDLSEIREASLRAPARELVNPGKVYVADDVLLIGEEGEGIHVFDNSNPESPEQTYFITIMGNKEFYVKGDKIYAESIYDVVKIDISNIEEPIIESTANNVFHTARTNDLGEVIIGFEFNEVTEKVETDFYDPKYQRIGKNDPVYLDFQNKRIPSSELPVSFAGNSNSSIATVNRIAHAKDHLYLIDRTNIYSIEDRDELRFIGSNRIGRDMETIYPQDDALFIGTRNSMEILSHLGTFTHVTACDPVLPNGQVAYVTIRGGRDCGGTVDGLFVIGISNLAKAEELQNIDMESPYGMTIIGNQLFVGEGENGLKIFDISTDGYLQQVAHHRDVIAYDVIPHPTNPSILLATSPAGFGQYEITTNGSSLLSWISS